MDKRHITASTDWWKENPREIVLVVFLLVGFAFFYMLPSQGWGIDPKPANAPVVAPK